jgi:hypothetical protein
MEDETYVDPNVYHVKHHGKGPALDDDEEEEDDEDEDEEEDLCGQERDEDDDPLDDDDGSCKLMVVKPIYMFPNKPVKYHGT